MLRVHTLQATAGEPPAEAPPAEEVPPAVPTEEASPEARVRPSVFCGCVCLFFFLHFPPLVYSYPTPLREKSEGAKSRNLGIWCHVTCASWISGREVTVTRKGGLNL